MPKAVTFIAGNDDFLVTRSGREHFARLCEGIEDELSKETLDGNAGTVEEAEKAVALFQSAVQTISLFGGEKAVWLKDISFLGETRVGKAEGGKAAAARLAEIVETLQEDSGVRVLLTAFPVDRRRKEFKRLGELCNAEFVEGGGSEESLMAEAQKQARAHGIELGPEAAQALVARVGGNTRLILAEVEKLAVYLNEEGAEVTAELVTQLVPVFGEGDFFEAAEAFFSGDLEWALEALRRHFFFGYDARPLLTNLQNRCRLLIQLRALMDAGELDSRVNKNALARAAQGYAQHFGGVEDKTTLNVFSQNPFYLSGLAGSAQRFSLKQLTRCQSAFLAAFAEILDRPQEQEEVLRAMTVKCLGGGPPARA